MALKTYNVQIPSKPGCEMVPDVVICETIEPTRDGSLTAFDEHGEVESIWAPNFWQKVWLDAKVVEEEEVEEVTDES